VGSIQIRGAEKTKGDIMAEQVKSVLFAKNFAGLIDSVHEATSKLRELDIFESVQVTLDTDRTGSRKRQGGLGSGQEGSVVATAARAQEEETLRVVFKVKEKSLVHAGLGLEHGVQAGGAVSHQLGGCGFANRMRRWAWPFCSAAMLT